MPTVDRTDTVIASASPQWLLGSLRRMGIVCTHIEPRCAPLAGGVSSDIYRVELPSATICVKRALPKLRVAADWRAPTERNRHEVAWMRAAGAIVPGAVPEIVGEDPEAGAFAMRYLPQETHPVWKERLRDGDIDIAAAASVGDLLGRIHAETAGSPRIADRFANDAIFDAIRLDPYLIATGRAHRDLAKRFDALANETRAHKHARTHERHPSSCHRSDIRPVIFRRREPASTLAAARQSARRAQLEAPTSHGRDRRAEAP